MPYTDFTLDTIRQSFSLHIQTTPLFAAPPVVEVPVWLEETLAKGLPFALGSEKARSEFIIVPILLTLRDLSAQKITIYSGQRLEGDPSNGLTGECDFILTTTPPLPIIQSPIISIVEAKKNDIELGLGQCAAQMLGAQRFNQRDQTGITTIYGCVTTGEAWQFLRLSTDVLAIDSERYYINEVGVVLSIFLQIIASYPVASSQAG
jgi:hypothetical protein